MTVMVFRANKYNTIMTIKEKLCVFILKILHHASNNSEPVGKFLLNAGLTAFEQILF